MGPDPRRQIFQDVIDGPGTSCRSFSYISAAGEIRHTHVYLKSEPNREAIDLCVLSGFLGAFGVGNLIMEAPTDGNAVENQIDYLADAKIFYEILRQQKYFDASTQPEMEAFDLEAEVISAVSGLCQ
jgi:hypothetical protein